MPRDRSTQSTYLTRRQILITAGAGLVTIAALPSFAFEDDEKEDASDSLLNRHERVSLSALGETLLPGASKAGIVPYVQHQLKSETPLLFLRYMDYSDDCLAFYKKGLQALEAFSLSRFGAAFPDLSDEQQSDLVSSLSKASPPDWDGPPSPLFYFVVRNDAIDVVYGTEEGFRKLDVPYLALISPPKKW